ncbi:MAG TPA: hypothetical protein VI685_02350 [Candidatus Angelobacter sp.]
MSLLLGTGSWKDCGTLPVVGRLLVPERKSNVLSIPERKSPYFSITSPKFRIAASSEQILGLTDNRHERAHRAEQVRGRIGTLPVVVGRAPCSGTKKQCFVHSGTKISLFFNHLTEVPDSGVK